MKPKLNFYNLLWIFLISSFLGVVLETLWCFLRFGHFESRSGLIYGPFNLVYGFGALLITLPLRRLSERHAALIVPAGMLIGGIFEYACSLFQELVFGTVSWDYSGFLFNIGGRINLLYCFFWGLLALLWIKFILPPLLRLEERIPRRLRRPLAVALIIFLLLDTAISGCAVLRMSRRHDGIPPSNAFWRYIDEHYSEQKIRKVYPNMQFVYK